MIIAAWTVFIDDITVWTEHRRVFIDDITAWTEHRRVFIGDITVWTEHRRVFKWVNSIFDYSPKISISYTLYIYHKSNTAKMNK